MNVGKSCPITFEKIDENIVRIQAGIISILGLLYLYIGSPLLLMILFYDFLIRILGYKQISSFYVASLLVKQYSLPKKLVDSGPKKFAAKIGFVFVVLANIFFYINFVQFSDYTIAILVLCAMLESLLGFCVACQIYPLYRKFVN